MTAKKWLRIKSFWMLKNRSYKMRKEGKNLILRRKHLRKKSIRIWRIFRNKKKMKKRKENDVKHVQ